MRLLNRACNALADLVLRPFAHASPWAALSVVSFLAALALVGLFVLTSNQPALRRARNRFVARTLELLLFRHELRVSLTACGRILATNFAYLGQFIRPLLLSGLPMLLILVQMGAWFESRPLKVGETAVVDVTLRPSHPVMETSVELVAPETVAVEAGGVRIAARNESSWRVRALAEGDSELQVRMDEVVETKRVAAGSRLARVSNERAGGVWHELLHPSEPTLAAASPVASIELRHPARQLFLGGHEVHWLVASIVLMMAFGLVLGRLFGVRIA